MKEVCNYFAYLSSPEVIQMVEGGKVTANNSLCSLHQTATEEVRRDSIMYMCRAGPTLTKLDCTCLITSSEANLMGLSCLSNGTEVRLLVKVQGDYGTQEFNSGDRWALNSYLGEFVKVVFL